MSVRSDALFSVEGRTIVLTGGYGKLGRTFAEGLLERGANVVVIERAGAAAMVADIFPDHAGSDRLLVVEADVTRRESLEAALETIRARGLEPDGLINNAAIDSPPDSPPEENGPFEDYPEASWDRVFDVNTKGVFLCCQVFGAAMAHRKSGSIINIGSIYGVVSPDQALYQYRRDRGEVFFKPVAYSASKSALYNLTRYLAVYWGPKNVRSNILTFAGVFGGQDPAFLNAYAAKIPLRRGAADEGLANMASARDYLGALIYLLSDASSYVTGSEMRVDGGFTAL
ncbi:MAG: SDR family oxidoreductase [Oceanicaulis sp.]